MRTIEIIANKRDGRELTVDEIRYMVDGYVADKIPDYQMSAFLMAVYLCGMTGDETFGLTQAIIDSGSIVDLSRIKGVKVDKHSTGGVGDKVTLILAPLVASAGLHVAKMSGRGLGHTGGTLDKLESIPNFSVNLSTEQFIEQVNTVGMAVMGQSEQICPADKKLYALRDATATVSSMPLIASSVMSKKIAGGADVIILDVKAGSGAFMDTTVKAKELARSMIGIGRRFNKKVVAIISNMDQPLGIAIGNSLEVQEAIDTLKGFGSPDLLELSFTLGALMMVKTGMVEKTSEAVDILNEKIESGEALAKFKQFIEAQGGDSSCIDDPRSVLPHARFVEDYGISLDGFIMSIDAGLMGIAAGVLGAGREKKDDIIDHSAGIVLVRKVGDFVHAGDIILEMHSNDPQRITEAQAIVDDAIRLSQNPRQAVPVIYDIIE